MGTRGEGSSPRTATPHALELTLKRSLGNPMGRLGAPCGRPPVGPFRSGSAGSFEKPKGTIRMVTPVRPGRRRSKLFPKSPRETLRAGAKASQAARKGHCPASAVRRRPYGLTRSRHRAPRRRPATPSGRGDQPPLDPAPRRPAPRSGALPSSARPRGHRTEVRGPASTSNLVRSSGSRAPSRGRPHRSPGPHPSRPGRRASRARTR